MSKKAIVTGITGQDAAWLSEILLNHGYKVYGAIRRNSHRNLYRLKYLGIDKDIELIEVVRRQDEVIQRLKRKGIETDVFNSLTQESWASPSDYGGNV